MADPAAKATARIRGVIAGLEHPDELAAVTARALLDAAQAKASSRPTPQAPMVAAGFQVDAETIRGPSGTLGELAMGAEFGSTIYRQFGGRHSGGGWLFPTLREPPTAVDNAQADYLENLLNG